MKNKYHFIGEDDHTFTVRHPDGSDFSVVKKAISSDLHKRIKALEPLNMADGGFVPEAEFVGASSMPSEEIVDPTLGIKPDPNFDLMDQYRSFAKANDINASPEEIERKAQDLLLANKKTQYIADNARQLADQKRADVIAARDAQYNLEAKKLGLPLRPASGPAATVPGGAVSPSMLLQESSQGQNLGIDPARATSSTFGGPPALSEGEYFKSMLDANNLFTREAVAAGKQNANSIAEAEAKVDKINKYYDEEIAKNEAEHKQIFDAYTSGKVNPNQYWQNLSTGNKILATISVVLGSIGSGLTGQKNMGLEILNKAIEQDIDAQKSELGKKQTLLSENLRRYGNLQDARKATTAQLWTGVNAMIQSRAAQLGSVEAASKGKIEGAKIGLKVMELNKDLAYRRALERGFDNLSDAQVLSLPEEYRKNAVKLGGKWTRAIDESSAKEARDVVASNDSLMGILDQIIEYREKYGSETVPGPVKSRMQLLGTMAKTAMIKADKLGTLDKGVEKFTEALASDPTGYGFKHDQYKALKEAQAKKTIEKLNAYGIDSKSIDHYRSALMRVPEKLYYMNGKPYKKVSGGYQEVAEGMQ